MDSQGAAKGVHEFAGPSPRVRRRWVTPSPRTLQEVPEIDTGLVLFIGFEVSFIFS